MIPPKASALLSEIFWTAGELERVSESFPADTTERLKLAFWCLRNGGPESDAVALLEHDAIAIRVFESAMRRPIQQNKVN